MESNSRDIFDEYSEQINSSIRPYVKVTAQKGQVVLTSSKIGGTPYWPANMEYPLDSEGKSMRLLAQINFSEVPQLDEYPDSGILQFFIKAEDDVCGMDFDNLISQKGSRVIYHDSIDVESMVSDFEQYNIAQHEWFPALHECKLEFSLLEEAVPQEDYKFVSYFGDESYQLFSSDECEEYYNKFSSTGHKIGGYAYFTQGDPRMDDEYKEYEYLLFQLDSDDSIEMMWGDVGVANFFITKEDLRRRDFSKVLYTWDCC